MLIEMKMNTQMTKAFDLMIQYTKLLNLPYETMPKLQLTWIRDREYLMELIIWTTT